MPAWSNYDDFGINKTKFFMGSMHVHAIPEQKLFGSVFCNILFIPRINASKQMEGLLLVV